MQHLYRRPSPMSSAPSFVAGSRSPALWEYTLGDLIERQAANFGDRVATRFSWQHKHCLSYKDLAARSAAIAKSLLARGLKHGDHVAIMAGNCYQYIEVFLAASRIGCPLIVLNNTYSAKELTTALRVTCESGASHDLLQCSLICEQHAKYFSSPQGSSTRIYRDTFKQ
jgi:non-ribosomal peptide synthetase component E (peptide arylation enzyme)